MNNSSFSCELATPFRCGVGTGNRTGTAEKCGQTFATTTACSCIPRAVCRRIIRLRSERGRLVVERRVPCSPRLRRPRRHWFQFGPVGEENAFRFHATSFNPKHHRLPSRHRTDGHLARRARLCSELRYPTNVVGEVPVPNWLTAPALPPTHWM